MSPTTQVIISKLAFEMRLVVIVILSSFLLGNSFFKELFRINILIHHYQEHKQVDPEISFFKFLSQHYTNKINHADDEHNDHKNLPFKTKDCNRLVFLRLFSTMLPIVLK